MAVEIERKFLVSGELPKADGVTIINQGYISTNPKRIVRIRTSNDVAYITIKGKSNESGLSRYEWEKEIHFDDALDLLLLCDNVIHKTRYLYEVGSHVFEVDIFERDNKGLVLAEVELSSENETFSKPDWLGKEVTGDAKYYNSNLLNKPYSKW